MQKIRLQRFVTVDKTESWDRSLAELVVSPADSNNICWQIEVYDCKVMSLKKDYQSYVDAASEITKITGRSCISKSFLMELGFEQL